jgi:thiol:disulfide interchange protein
MIKMRALLVAGLLAAMAASAGPAAAQSLAAYDQALADAKAQNKTVLLDFFTDW